MADIQISKVNIKIGDKDIELTLDEVQELMKVLHQSFMTYHGTEQRVERIVERWGWPHGYYQYWIPTINCTVTDSNGDIRTTQKAIEHSLTIAAVRGTQ